MADRQHEFKGGKPSSVFCACGEPRKSPVHVQDAAADAAREAAFRARFVPHFGVRQPR